ncbi:hypothetical protein BDD12DRAFT_103636 [Trichophaea hybrida]|nr:hypothetical protein BDD12DRAFT_103636 [Trichophaea hybrida]
MLKCFIWSANCSYSPRGALSLPASVRCAPYISTASTVLQLWPYHSSIAIPLWDRQGIPQHRQNLRDGKRD